MDWATGYEPDQPFGYIDFYHPPPPPPLSPSSPYQRPRGSEPTAYYLSQAPFYAENFGPDPFATAPDVPRPRILQALVDRAFELCSAARITSLVATALSLLGTLLRRVFECAVLQPALVVAGWACRFEVWAVLALVLVNQLLKYMPSWGGREVLEVEVEVGRDGALVYNVFLRGGREAIGTGPVTRSGV